MDMVHMVITEVKIILQPQDTQCTAQTNCKQRCIEQAALKGVCIKHFRIGRYK